MSVNRVQLNELKRSLVRTLLNLSVLVVFSVISLSSHAQSCPQTFTLESETTTQLICLFSANISAPSTNGTPAHETTEGSDIAQDAVNLCSAASGQPFVFSQGTTGVRVRCTLAQTTPPTPVTPAPVTPAPVTPTPVTPTPVSPTPTNPNPMPPAVQPIDFDDNASFEAAGTGDVASSLANLCTSFRSTNQLTDAQVDLLVLCERINSATNIGNALSTIQQVAGRQYSEIADLIGFQNSIQVGDIGSRLASVRPAMEQNARDVARGGELVHPNQGLLARSQHVNGSKIGGAAGDYESKGGHRFGAFLAVSGGSGDKESTTLSRGFDYQSRSATVGIDYIVNSSLIAGLAFGYGSTESSLSQNSGQLDIETGTISAYLSKFLNNGWFVDGIIGYGNVDTESRRNIDFTIAQETISQVAIANFDSDQTLLSAGIGKSLEAFIDIDISARVNYIDTKVERFSEATNPNQLGFGLALEIEEQDITSLTTDIAIQFSKAYSVTWGVLIPRLSLRWQHELERGENALLGRFLADPSGFDLRNANLNIDTEDSTLFRVPLELLDTNYGSAKLGISALLPNQFSLNASVSQSIGLSGFDHTYYSFTLRRDF